MNFLGVRGLTTLSYIEYDYTTSGHVDQKSIYILYIQYIHISIQDTYILYNRFSFFLME